MYKMLNIFLFVAGFVMIGNHNEVSASSAASSSDEEEIRVRMVLTGVEDTFPLVPRLGDEPQEQPAKSLYERFLELEFGSNLGELCTKSLLANITLWAPHLSVGQIAKLGKDYLVKEAVPIPATQDGVFGNSFPYSDTLNTALIEIHARQLNGRPPVVWDLACGHGFASLYSLIAGAGSVYSLDTHAHVLKQFQREAVNIKEFLPEGTRVNTHLKLMVFDVQPPSKYDILPNPDVIFCFNFLHFLSPSAQKALILNSYIKLKPGGSCFFLGESFYSASNLTELFLTRLRVGHRTPGYCWVYFENNKVTCLAEFPNEKYEQPPGSLGRKKAFPGKVITVRNFLHPDPLKKMLKSIGIPEENYTFFYDGFPYRMQNLIPEAEFDERSSQPHKLALIIRKPESEKVSS